MREKKRIKAALAARVSVAGKFVILMRLFELVQWVQHYSVSVAGKFVILMRAKIIPVFNAMDKFQLLGNLLY